MPSPPPCFCNTRCGMRVDASGWRRGLSLAILGGALASAVACGGAGASSRSTVRVVIPAGSTLRAAADTLARARVIGSPLLFRAYAAIRRRDRGVKAGIYLLHRNSSWAAALDALRSGRGLVYALTIPEGFSLAQIRALLQSRMGLSEDEIDLAVRDTAILRELDIPTPTLEGYLYPDTYLFPRGATARSVVAAMVHRFEQVWRPEWTARLDSVALSRHDIMALASIVEREARLPEERPVIAAVYLNRLRIGMPLQADPTVQYALGRHVARVFYKDLEIDSPYNTYRHKGLPPGPIASPGSASIQAALYPANVPYKFFVASPDGHHEFRIDLAGHAMAKVEARKAWSTLEAARRADSTRRARDSVATPAPARTRGTRSASGM
jgi:peptidoglycan lytic transglycosylase G